MAELTVRKVKESLSEKVNREMTLKEQISLTMSLSAPAIMAQLSCSISTRPWSEA